jgi:hypothetical protein
MGVFFISREPVRSPEPLRAFAEVRAGLERNVPGAPLAGSLSATSANRFVIAPGSRGLGSAPESSLVEVYEYDVARFQVMVIGLVEPPPETPIHWIARRVNPQQRLVAVVPAPPPLADPLPWTPHPRGYLGDPNTLLAIGRLLKGRSVAAIERIGLVACAADGVSLALVLKGALKPSTAAR